MSAVDFECVKDGLKDEMRQIIKQICFETNRVDVSGRI